MLVKEVQQALHERVQFVTEALPPQKSSYGAQRDFEITLAKAAVIQGRLKEIRASLGADP